MSYMECVLCVLSWCYCSRQDFYYTHFALLNEYNQVVHITKDLASYVVYYIPCTYVVHYTYFVLHCLLKNKGLMHKLFPIFIYLFCLFAVAVVVLCCCSLFLYRIFSFTFIYEYIALYT